MMPCGWKCDETMNPPLGVVVSVKMLSSVPLM